MEKKKASILVVDDELEMRELICDFLGESEKYQLFSACNGNEALEMLNETPIDIIISDINMPGMKGFELLKEVKARYPGIKRVLITAYNVEDYFDLALQYDISNIFVKTVPFNFQELTVTIEKLLNNDIFGLHHYFDKNTAFYNHKIFNAQQLDKDANTIVQFINHPSETHRLELVIVELLTNAIFYGVRNEKPDQKDGWDHNFTLPEDLAVKVTLAKDSEKYGISISDMGGRLKKSDVLFWLNRQASHDLNGLPVGLFDTHGRGLFIARKYIDRLIINIDQARCTEVIIINYYVNSFKGFKPLYINEI